MAVCSRGGLDLAEHGAPPARAGRLSRNLCDLHEALYDAHAQNTVSSREALDWHCDIDSWKALASQPALCSRSDAGRVHTR